MLGSGKRWACGVEVLEGTHPEQPRTVLGLRSAYGEAGKQLWHIDGDCLLLILVLRGTAKPDPNFPRGCNHSS